MRVPRVWSDVHGTKCTITPDVRKSASGRRRWRLFQRLSVLLECLLGRSPISSNAKDYFTRCAHFHWNSIILLDQKRMDTIGKGPAILSTCVKRWRFFACKIGFLLQDRTKFGTAGLFQQTEHAKAVYELLFTLSPRRPILTLLRKS